MKNVSQYAGTSRWQYKLVVFGQFFGEVGFEKDADAGFVCDLCKTILTRGFELQLHRSIDFSLPPDVFTSKCQAAGLNIDNPISWCEYELLPESFRAYVKANRAEWEANILQRAKHDPKGDKDYARYSDNPATKQWGLQRLALAQRVARFNLCPLSWWRNLFLGCTNSLRVSRKILDSRLSPSLHSKLSPTECPELFAKLHAAYESVLLSQHLVAQLEESLALVGDTLRSDLKRHDEAKPNPNEKVS
jgi:hypothetical protein